MIWRHHLGKVKLRYWHKKRTQHLPVASPRHRFCFFGIVTVASRSLFKLIESVIRHRPSVSRLLLTVSPVPGKILKFESENRVRTTEAHFSVQEIRGDPARKGGCRRRRGVVQLRASKYRLQNDSLRPASRAQRKRHTALLVVSLTTELCMVRGRVTRRSPRSRVSGSLVVVLQDAEHFDPFFANACVACAQQILGAQVTTGPHCRRFCDTTSDLFC